MTSRIRLLHNDLCILIRNTEKQVKITFTCIVSGNHDLKEDTPINQKIKFILVNYHRAIKGTLESRLQQKCACRKRKLITYNEPLNMLLYHSCMLTKSEIAQNLHF